MAATRVVSIFEVGDYAEQIHQAVELLRQGRLVVLPTETVYGAAGVLTNPQALDAIRRLRPEGRSNSPSAKRIAPATPGPEKPLVPHLADAAQASGYLGPVNDFGRRMMRKLWPGPVALIFDVPPERREEVSRGLAVRENDLYDNGTITLRCPDHPVALDILRQVEAPVVAVRAGVGSSQPALKASTIAEELEGRVDLVIDSGPPKYSKASTIVRVKENSYQVVRSGVYDERIIERLLRTTILFVCSGNTCRSPMAEAIARHVIAGKLKVPESELEKKGINVMSAGAQAMPGARATPQAVDAVRSLGADLSHHRSRPLSVELIHQADVIYTMSQNHLQAVRSLVPMAADKVKTLARERDIEDPIGSDEAVYQKLAGELQTLIEDRLKETVLT